jgi:hypothetical protein
VWIADSGNRPNQLSIAEIAWSIPGIGYPNSGAHPAFPKTDGYCGLGFGPSSIFSISRRTCQVRQWRSL